MTRGSPVLAGPAFPRPVRRARLSKKADERGGRRALGGAARRVRTVGRRARSLRARLRNEQELRFAARIKGMQREEQCECPEPARPAGLDNPNTPPQYKLFRDHCTRCLGRIA
jgi:hypothetical protein